MNSSTRVYLKDVNNTGGFRQISPFSVLPFRTLAKSSTCLSFYRKTTVRTRVGGTASNVWSGRCWMVKFLNRCSRFGRRKSNRP